MAKRRVIALSSSFGNWPHAEKSVQSWLDVADTVFIVADRFPASVERLDCSKMRLIRKSGITSIAQSCNLVLGFAQRVLFYGEDPVFLLLDRDIVLRRAAISGLPEGMIGLGVRNKNIRKVNGKWENVPKGTHITHTMKRAGVVSPFEPTASLIAMRASTSIKVGKFQELFTYSEDFWGIEDTDWLFRAVKNGFLLYRFPKEVCSGDHVWHKMDVSSKFMRRVENSRRMFKLQHEVDVVEKCHEHKRCLRYIARLEGGLS